jgi:ATP-binding cassette subfamily B protein/subfamily B ATP-binding cassette protein MsbA
VLNKNWGKALGRMPFVERLGRMLATEDKEYPHEGTESFQALSRGIRFEDVSMRYPDTARDALRGLTLEVRKGAMVALVGGSGAGKTTVANLLLRLYEPTGGSIQVDGTDLRRFRWSSWRDRIGVVSQDTFIFHASVRENIGFGKLDATDEEIRRAARIANADSFIEQLVDGYETVVGEQGYRLSGGQRQRLSIARAILRDPEILILDEATSDLDSRSERLIQESIEELRRQRTVLAIAHRLSTVRMADEIVVLEEGELVERGSHAELVRHDGRYADLWRLQSGAA